MINPELNIGDKVILLHMQDLYRSVTPGTKGVVLAKNRVLGDDIYTVNWEDGSQLSLVSGVDMWDTVENFESKKKDIKEFEITKKSIIEVDEYERSKALLKNIDVFKHFNMKFLNQYLKMIKNSGIVNMWGASPYLYMGRERIEHEFKYKNINNEEAYNDVLENADISQHEMINGVINILNSEGKEVTVENINRYIGKYATKVLMNYIHLF
jgi:hypothetical protein